MKEKPLKLTFDMIVRRGHYGYFFFYWIYGLIMDYRLAKKSLNRTIFNKESGAYPVQSISYPYIRALVPRLDLGADDAFVDVGCAWGRLLGYLRAHIAVKKLYGVELNPEIAICAQRIFRNTPEVEIISGDILGNLPEDGTCFYLFNPFDQAVFQAFIEKIETTIYHPVKLLYLHPTCRQVLDAGREHWTQVNEYEIKPRHHGPLTLCVYEYTPGKENGTGQA